MLKEKEKKIYMIQHNITRRIYIGSTIDIDERIAHHFYNLKAGKHPVEDMQDDFNKYGNDFTVSVIGTIKNSKEKYKEYEAMDKYQSCKRGIGYNYKDAHTRKNAKRQEYINGIIKQIRHVDDMSFLDLIYQLLIKHHKRSEK